MASIYGATHDIFNTHHIETKAKLDTLLGHNDGVEGKLDTGNASLASVDGKVTACDTGAVVVSSSALPAGASSEASLSAMSAKITACDTGAVVIASSALPAGASLSSKQDTGNASLASVDGKVTACDTGAVVIASSALPAGASLSAKQDEIKTLITATNSALAGTLTVSAPAISKSSSTPISAQSVAMASSHLSSEIDLNTAKHISIFGDSDDSENSHEVDLLVSNVSGGTFYPSSHSGYFMEGYYHSLITDIPYRYVKIQVVNANATMASTFTLHLVEST